jgi:hypothetical protein
VSSRIRERPDAPVLLDEWGDMDRPQVTRGWARPTFGDSLPMYYRDDPPAPLVVFCLREETAHGFAVEVHVVPYILINKASGARLVREYQKKWRVELSKDAQESALFSQMLREFGNFSAHSRVVCGKTLLEAKTAAIVEGRRLQADLEWLFSLYCQHQPFVAEERPVACPAGIIHPTHFSTGARSCMCGIFEYESTQRKVWGAPSWEGRYRKHLVRTWREMRKLKVLGVDFGSRELDKLDDRSP